MKSLLPYILCVIFLYSGCKSNDLEPEENINKNIQKQNNQVDLHHGSFNAVTYDNGQIRLKGDSINKKREGLWISYYQNGTKQSESTYINGVKNGNSVSYYEDGKIRYVGFYLEGKKHGKWIFKDKNQLEEKEVWYEKGAVKD